MNEAELYLRAPVIGEDSEIPVLQLWKRIEHSYPSLASMARDILAIPGRLAGPDRGTGTGPDWTDFSAVRSQSKRPDRETVSIFGPDRTETFIAQAFINTLN